MDRKHIPNVQWRRIKWKCKDGAVRSMNKTGGVLIIIIRYIKGFSQQQTWHDEYALNPDKLKYEIWKMATQLIIINDNNVMK